MILLIKMSKKNYNIQNSNAKENNYEYNNLKPERNTFELLTMDQFFLVFEKLTGQDIDEFEGETLTTSNCIFKRVNDGVIMLSIDKKENSDCNDENLFIDEVINHQENDDNRCEIRDNPENVSQNSELEKKNAEGIEKKRKMGIQLKDAIENIWNNCCIDHPITNGNYRCKPNKTFFAKKKLKKEIILKKYENDGKTKNLFEDRIENAEDYFKQKFLNRYPPIPFEKSKFSKNIKEFVDKTIKTSNIINKENDGKREDGWRKKIFGNLFRFPFLIFKDVKNIFLPDHLLITQNINITLLIIFVHLQYYYLCQMTKTRYQKLCEYLQNLNILNIKTYHKMREVYSKKDIQSSNIFKNIDIIQKIYREENNNILNEDQINDFLEKSPIDFIDYYESSKIIDNIRKDKRNESLKNIPYHLYINKNKKGDKGNLMEWIESNPEYTIFDKNKDNICQIIKKIFSEDEDFIEEKKKNDIIRETVRQNGKKKQIFKVMLGKKLKSSDFC